jgi:uroporphyrinogen-III synthase
MRPKLLRVQGIPALSLTKPTTESAMPDRPKLLITRPIAQQEPFAGNCRDLGFDTVALPCIEITPVDAALPMPLINSAKLILFTSRNAVVAAHRLQPLPWPDARIEAIGNATADALTEFGQPLARPPAPPYTSEAFLDTHKFSTANAPLHAPLDTHKSASRSVQDTHKPTAGIPDTQKPDTPQINHLLLIKGEGGRDLIERTIGFMGVQISVVPVYRRVRPAVDATTLDWASLDIISVTSDEILCNLMALAGAKRSPLLKQLPLVVNSRRCAALAKELGFTDPAQVASPAGDAGQTLQLQTWLTAFIEVN